MKLYSNKEEKVLKELLSCAVNQEEVFSLASLHGYLYCLALIPEIISPDEWLGDIFGEEMLAPDDEEQANRVMGGLVAVYNRFMEQSNNNALRFPFQVGKLKDSDLERIRDWAYGFFLATSLRPEVLGLPEDYNEFIDSDDEDVTEEEQEIAASLMILMGVAFPEKIPDLLEPGEDDSLEQLDPIEQQARFLSLLPVAVETFQAVADESRDAVYQQGAPFSSLKPVKTEKIGRNEACPCGSGKKYKKCCGMN